MLVLASQTMLTVFNYESHLNAIGGINYLWSPATNISAINISNPVVTPTADTRYFVTAFDGNGCKNKDSVLVYSSIANKEQVKFEISQCFYAKQ